MLGKIAMVMIFMIRETPGALQTLAIYPVLIVLYLQCTYSRRDRNTRAGRIGTLLLCSCFHVFFFRWTSKWTSSGPLFSILWYKNGLQLHLFWMPMLRRLELMAKEGDGQSATVKTLMHAHNSYKLISCYDKRTLVVRQFEEVLKDQRKFVNLISQFSNLFFFFRHCFFEGESFKCF